MKKSCVVYLIRGTEASCRLFEKSISLLRKNFLPWSPADVIVFHEADFDPCKLDGRTSDVPLRFGLVDFSAVPSELSEVPPNQRGYRHMCHFFANDIFLREELRGYDYYMRMDDDSFILSPLKFNVFDRMYEGGYRYAYRAILKDRPQACKGFGNVVNEFISSNPDIAHGPGWRDVCWVYYNNFEICDLNWFRGEGYQRYFKAVDDAGGIWHNRWGDHIIRYFGLNALLPKAAVLCLKELHYFHQAEWRAGFKRRLPWDFVRYYTWITGVLVREYLERRRALA